MMKLKYLIAYISLAMLIVACSTTKAEKQEVTPNRADTVQSKPEKTEEKQEEKATILKIAPNKELDNLYAKADASFSLMGMSNNATVELKIVGNDSSFARVNGPFGIPVAKAYSRQNYILLMDSFNGVAYEAEPTAESMYKLIGTPLSYDNILDILRARLIFQSENYTFLDSANSRYRYAYEFMGFKDILIIDKYDRIISYKREKAGTLVFMVDYSYSGGKGNANYLKSLRIGLPENSHITFDFNEYQLFTPDGKPFYFDIPQKIKVRKI